MSLLVAIAVCFLFFIFAMQHLVSPAPSMAMKLVAGTNLASLHYVVLSTLARYLYIVHCKTTGRVPVTRSASVVAADLPVDCALDILMDLEGVAWDLERDKEEMESFWKEWISKRWGMGKARVLDGMDLLQGWLDKSRGGKAITVIERAHKFVALDDGVVIQQEDLEVILELMAQRGWENSDWDARGRGSVFREKKGFWERNGV
jgi:hypothetical protein